jgi:hypothetical protein
MWGIIKVKEIPDKMKEESAVIKIERPMVLIPYEEYEELLFLAGELKTPKLDKEIKKARKEFKQGKSTPWEKVKSELL